MTRKNRNIIILVISSVIWITSALLLYNRFVTGKVIKNGSMRIIEREMKIDQRTGKTVEKSFPESRQVDYLLMITMALAGIDLILILRKRKKTD